MCRCSILLLIAGTNPHTHTDENNRISVITHDMSRIASNHNTCSNHKKVRCYQQTITQQVSLAITNWRTSCTLTTIATIVPIMYMYMYKTYPSVLTKHLARAPAKHEPDDDLFWVSCMDMTGCYDDTPSPLCYLVYERASTHYIYTKSNTTLPSINITA